jgi:hypothetical protein
MDENLGYVQNPNPNCKCCGVRIEYNSTGYRAGLCISCSDAVDKFINNRREGMRKRGLIN